jgi:ketosteroid isomerase-like protein
MTLAAVALAATVGSVTLATADAGPGAAETARNLEIVREAFALWEDGEPVFGALLADDVVWTIAGSGPVARTYRGQADFIEQASAPLLSRLATPLIPEVHAIWADGDTVIVRFDGEATTTSGAPYRNQFVWIFEMEDGKVHRGEAFLDLAAYQAVLENNAPKAE